MGKRKNEKRSSPVDLGPYLKETRLSNGRTLLSEKGRTIAVKYGAGVEINFNYGPDGKITAMRDLDGEWNLVADTQTWLHADGRERFGKISISEEGDCVLTGSGVQHIFCIEGVWIERLDIDDVLAFVKENFKELDQNQDGVISRAEIAAAIQDDSFTDKSAQCLMYLQLCCRHLQRFSILQGSKLPLLQKLKSLIRYNRGVDVDTIAQLQVLLQEQSLLAELTTAQVPLWMLKSSAFSLVTIQDQDKDWAVTKDELKSSVGLMAGKLALNQCEKQLEYLEAVRRYLLLTFDTISQDGKRITIFDLWRHLQSAGLEAQYLAHAMNELFVNSQNRPLHSQKQLYESTEEPIKSIRPEAIRQGFIGDCMFLGILGSVAALNPQLICDAIVINPDGTYTVTFPGASAEPIVVSCPTDAELKLYASNAGFGIWPAVMEKACGEYYSRSVLRRLSAIRPGLPNPLLGSAVISENAAYGGWHLFGAVSMRPIGLMTDDDFATLIQGQVAARRPAIVAISRFNCDQNDERQDSKPALHPRHAYALVGYDEAERRIKIYNPWGTLSRENLKNTGWNQHRGGMLEMSLESAYKWLSVIWYAR